MDCAVGRVRERGEGVSEWVGCETERERGGFKEDRVEKV